jgi:predicted Zn-dependent peptidase
MGQQVYGPTHPLALNSGGEPSGIRTMKPQDIRDFHDANYYLANMGTIVAFPKSVPLDEVLQRTDAILRKAEAQPRQRASATSKPLPPFQPAPAGTIEIGEYPHRNEQQPSPLAFIWPATRTDLSAEDVTLLELFGDAFASDSTTNLYKLFVDSKTKVMDLGATGVFNNIDRDQGHAVAFVIDNVAPSNLTQETIAGSATK